MVSREEAEVFSEFCGLASRNFSDYKAVDPPDFVHEECSVAVELVRYHRDQSARQSIARKVDESAKSLVELARELYKQRYSESVDVYVTTQDQWWASRGRVQKMADHLAELVGHYRHGEVSIEGECLPAVIAGVISHVSIGPTPAYQTNSLWQYVAAAIAEVRPRAIQATLENKEKKIADYREHANSVELLIYSSAWPRVGDPTAVNPSSCGIVTNELLRTQFVTSFDAVHYLDRQWGRLIQLDVKKPLGNPQDH